MSTTTPDEVWAMLRELTATQQEMARQIQETDRMLDEISHKVDDLLNKKGSWVKNSELIGLNEAVDVTDATRRSPFGHWGASFCDQVQSDCSRLFPEMTSSAQRWRKTLAGGDSIFIDLLLMDEQQIMLMCVCETCRDFNIQFLLEDLQKFRRFYPQGADKHIYGAVAAITFDGGVERYAYQKGLFVLAQSGNNMAILNKPPFQPKSW